MLLRFLFLLILFEISGDSILQINKVFFKKDVNRFNLLEHFIFGLIIGILVNSTLTLLIVYFIPFNFWILLTLNGILLLIVFFFNNNSFHDFFYSRLINSLLGKTQINETKKFFKRFLIYLTFLVLIDIYLSTIIEWNHIMPKDTWGYVHYSLDSIRNGWNYYDPNYLFKDGNRIYYSNFFSFLLIPFLSIDPTNWMVIINVYLFRLQFYLFFSLIFLLLHRFNSRFSYLIIILYLSSFHFLTFFSYFLPTNFNIILILVLLNFIFFKDIKSNFIAIFLIIFLFLIHGPSLIVIFSIPIILTIFIKYVQDPKSFNTYKKFVELKLKFVKQVKKYKYLVIFTFLIVIFTFIIIVYPYIYYFIDLYLQKEGRLDATPTPVSELWENYIIFGLPITILLYFGIIFGLIIIKKKKKDLPIILWFLILSIWMTVILIDWDFWRHFIHISYLEYRYIIFLDFSFFLLIPIFFEIIRKSQNEFFKKRFKNLKIKSRINKLKIFTIKKSISLILLIALLNHCSTGILNNFHSNYNFSYFSKYWPSAYLEAVNFVNEIKTDNSTYMFYSESVIFTANWEFFHTYLGDTRCINPDNTFKYYNDSLYSSFNPNYLFNYNSFLNFVFNESKEIYSYMASYKNLPEDMRTTIKIEFIFIDSASNNYLTNLMRNDTLFNLIFEESMYWYRSNGDIDVLVFQCINL